MMKTRTDIAILLGISKRSLNNLLFTNQIRLPAHVEIKGTSMLYTDESVDNYIASDPLNNKYQFVVEEPPYTGLDLEMAQAFIRRPPIIDEDTPYADLPPVHKKGKTKKIRVQAVNIDWVRPVNPFINVDCGIGYTMDIYGNGQTYD
jgi:hypothetical protein